MSEVVVKAEIRQSTKKHAKYTRWNGMVPGVYYSRGEENINIQVPVPALQPAWAAVYQVSSTVPPGPSTHR